MLADIAFWLFIVMRHGIYIRVAFGVQQIMSDKPTFKIVRSVGELKKTLYFFSIQVIMGLRINLIQEVTLHTGGIWCPTDNVR